MIENPPWVTRVLNKYWEPLEALVGEHAMPIIDGIHRGKIKPREYGSGSYGTVMPTGDGEHVCKITSDLSEATFVAAALSIGVMPRGIVRYERIVALPETHMKRPLFVIWRQEAHDVEFLVRSAVVSWQAASEQQREAREAQKLLGAYMDAARYVRQATKDHGPIMMERAKKYEQEAFEFVAENYELIETPRNSGVRTVLSSVRGPVRVAYALRFCEVVFEMMHHNSPILTDVGTALEFYLSKNILLADVHARNIGKVTVSESGHEWETVAITDPGHAAFLTNEYDSVEIPSLGERPVAANVSQYEFVGDCTGMDGDVINYMKSREARPDQIEFEEFERLVGSGVAKEYEEQSGLPMRDDWNVTLWKSRLPSGTPVIYWTQSNIERVYVPHGAYDEAEERRILDAE